MRDLTNARLLQGTETDRQSTAIQALSEASRIMVSSLDLNHLLSRILDIAVKVLDCAGGSLYLWDPAAQRLIAELEYPGEPGEKRSLQPDSTVPGWVFRRRKSIIVDDVLQDSRFCSEIQQPAGEPVRSVMAAPLLTPDDCLGVLEVHDKGRSRSFDRLDIDILESLAGHAAYAIDNRLLSSGLKAQRQRLLTVEREIHKKLARDLHDGPAQWLAGMAMNLEYVVRLLEVSPEQAKCELETMRAALQRTIQQIRQLMFELRPIVLESDGLVAALRHYVDSVNSTGGVKLQLEVEPGDLAISMEVQRTVFDIVREALNNLRRHARTDEGWISLHRDGDNLIVSIKDNGQGFDLQAVQRDYAQRGSLGLLNMTERAAAVNGTLIIKSAPGEGTAIHLTLPMDADAG